MWEEKDLEKGEKKLNNIEVVNKLNLPLATSKEKLIFLFFVFKRGDLRKF
jgi:hypothetical protein